MVASINIQLNCRYFGDQGMDSTVPNKKMSDSDGGHNGDVSLGSNAIPL